MFLKKFTKKVEAIVLIRLEFVIFFFLESTRLLKKKS